MVDQTTLHQREADFHDEWARSTDIRSISVREAFESPTAVENRFLLQQMGSLAGRCKARWSQRPIYRRRWWKRR